MLSGNKAHLKNTGDECVHNTTQDHTITKQLSQLFIGCIRRQTQFREQGIEPPYQLSTSISYKDCTTPCNIIKLQMREEAKTRSKLKLLRKQNISPTVTKAHTSATSVNILALNKKNQTLRSSERGARS
jgi:hypothetical protein